MDQPTSIKPSRRSTRARLAAAILLCFTLASCGLSTGDAPPETKESPMPGTGFSALDESGIQRIKQNGSARFDFRDGAIAKSDVGLPDSAYAPDLVAPNGGKFQLQLEGVNGVLEAETDRIRFNTTDTMATLDTVHYFLTAGSLEDLSQLLRDGVEKYGIDTNAVEAWIDSVEADPGFKDNYALAPGNTLGFEVVYDLRYDGSSDTQVIIVSVSASEKIGS